MILNRINDYVDPKDLEVHIYKSGIYIVNYTLISSFSDSLIEITSEKEKIKIKGSKLIISKLKKDELFICGEISVVELG